MERSILTCGRAVARVQVAAVVELVSLPPTAREAPTAAVPCPELRGLLD